MIEYFVRSNRKLQMRVAAALGFFFVALVGCQRRAPNFSYELPVSSNNSLWQDDAGADDEGRRTELWYAHFINDSKVGHRRFVIEKRSDASGPLLRLVSEDHLETYRFGQRNEQLLTQASIENEPGLIRSFGYKLSTGENRSQVEGTVDGNQVHVKRQEGDDAPENATVPWPTNGPSIFAIERSLRSNPMSLGESRNVRVFRPLHDSMTTVRLTATAHESVDVGGTSRELLRIEVDSQNKDDLASVSTSWIDESGTIVKTVFPFMNRSMVLCSKEKANATNKPYNVDLGYRSVVPVEIKFDDKRPAKQAVYRVTLDSISPNKVFEAGLSQDVRVLGGNTAQIVVKEISPTSPPTVNPPEPSPTRDEEMANPLINFDHPRVRNLAEAVIDRNQDSWKTAKLLENTIYMQLDKTETGQIFDSAGVVAEKLSGDCSEHAVLLAAMCRSHGIPARVVVGLLYDKDRSGFLYHMWNEVWITDRWIPLDATIGKGRVGVDHIKFHHSSLAGQTPYQVVAPIMNVIGQLQIDFDGY